MRASMSDEPAETIATLWGPGKFNDIYARMKRPKSSSAGLSRRLLRQWQKDDNQALQKTGPDPVKRAILQVSVSQTKAIQYAETENIHLRYREHCYSALRHKLPLWAKKDYGYTGVDDLPEREEQFNVDQPPTSPVPRLHSTEVDWELMLPLEFLVDRNAVRSASCIGLADLQDREDIMWEKQRIKDLNEHIKVIHHILHLQKDINTLSQRLQSLEQEKPYYEQELLKERHKKTNVLDPLFNELIKISVSLSVQATEAEMNALVDVPDRPVKKGFDFVKHVFRLGKQQDLNTVAMQAIKKEISEKMDLDAKKRDFLKPEEHQNMRKKFTDIASKIKVGIRATAILNEIKQKKDLERILGIQMPVEQEIPKPILPVQARRPSALKISGKTKQLNVQIAQEPVIIDQQQPSKDKPTPPILLPTPTSPPTAFSPKTPLPWSERPSTNTPPRPSQVARISTTSRLSNVTEKLNTMSMNNNMLSPGSMSSLSPSSNGSRSPNTGSSAVNSNESLRSKE
ncbi:hypothetical protein EDD86DRAFT_67977 [Gorgonomyces haynaldii]|nr:hypothetical protein EDD86DRAFT_67977 [Gorgonomyces haynaldii]